MNNWTQDELAILRERYHEGLSAVQTFLPWRTGAAIRKQASLQNLTDENMSTRTDKSAAPVPAMDLYQQLWCVRFRKWCREVEPSPRFGVATIGGGYV